MEKIIRTQKDVENDKTIIITKQGDKVQRSGVLTLQQEKRLFERAGKTLKKNIAKSSAEIQADIVKEKKLQETLDLFDEKRKLEKSIKENTEKIDLLKKERTEIYRQAETMINKDKVDNSKEK